MYYLFIMEDDTTSFGSSPANEKYLNELTMKFLTNQTCYAKYLYKNDNAKYEEEQQFIKDCTTFNSQIVSITDTMCTDPQANDYGSDVKEAFHNYARIIIRYLEVKEKSDELQKEYDDTTMFPYSMDEPKPIPSGSINKFIKKS